MRRHGDVRRLHFDGEYLRGQIHSDLTHGFLLDDHRPRVLVAAGRIRLCRRGGFGFPPRRLAVLPPRSPSRCVGHRRVVVVGPFRGYALLRFLAVRG